MFAVDDSTTVFQEKAMQQMGLGTTGPADTVGDGECLFRSFSQQQAAHNCDRGTAWAMQNSEQAQLGFATARLRAADALQHTPDITAKVVAHAAQILDAQCVPNGPLLSQALGRKDVSCLPDVMAAKLRRTVAEGKV